MAEPFKPPPLESYEGPAQGFTPPPPVEDKAAAPTAKDFLGRGMAAVAGAAQAPGNMMEGIKGAIKGGVRTVYDPLSTVLPMPEPVNQFVHAQTEPSNMAQRVGSYAPDVALMFAPGGVLSRASEALPSAERAGQVLTQARTLGKDVPVDLTKAMTPALRAQELSRAGSSPPKVMADFLQRIPVHTSEPMMFPEARDFATNAGRLSVSEKLATNPPMGAQVKQLAKALSEANQTAAEQMGMGKEYASAIKEYKHAMQLGEAKEKVIDIAKKALAKSPYAAAAGAAGYGGYRIAKGLGE